jgi:hypothetical protein
VRYGGQPSRGIHERRLACRPKLVQTKFAFAPTKVEPRGDVHFDFRAPSAKSLDNVYQAAGVLLATAPFSRARIIRVGPFRELVMRRLLKNAIAAAVLIGIPTTAHADLITVTYDGTINTFGFNSTAFFNDRPETTIHGTFEYDSDAVGTPHPTLPFTIEFPLLSFSFVIDFPDIVDYSATDINFGRIQLRESSPRVDFTIQGIPVGPQLNGSNPMGVFFNLQDGSQNSNPLLSRDPNVFTPDALPGPFTLDDLAGAGQMFVEWGTNTTVRERGTFNLTSLSAVVSEPAIGVPEPSSVVLLSIGLLGVVLRGRRTRDPGRKILD